jgi:hypothetical protein
MAAIRHGLAIIFSQPSTAQECVLDSVISSASTPTPTTKIATTTPLKTSPYRRQSYFSCSSVPRPTSDILCSTLHRRQEHCVCRNGSSHQGPHLGLHDNPSRTNNHNILH